MLSYVTWTGMCFKCLCLFLMDQGLEPFSICMRKYSGISTYKILDMLYVTIEEIMLHSSVLLLNFLSLTFNLI